MAKQRSEIVIVREYQPDLHNQVQALLTLLTYRPGLPMQSEPEMSLEASHHSTLASQRVESKQTTQRTSYIDRWILEFPAARDDIDRMVDEVLHDVKDKQRSKR